MFVPDGDCHPPSVGAIVLVIVLVLVLVLDLALALVLVHCTCDCACSVLVSLFWLLSSLLFSCLSFLP